MTDSKKFLKIVEWSEEDNCYIGSIPGWIGKCCLGDNEEKVYKELSQILNEWIKIYKQDGLSLPSNKNLKKQYSGKFQIKIDKELHKLLDIYAMQNNESLNTYCANLIKENIQRL